MNITIAGTGYVGLVTAVCLAQHGHNITCFDIDNSRIEKMKMGISPIFENGLEELMHRNNDKLTYTTDYTIAYQNPEVILICVGTPEKKDGSANLSYVYDVVDKISQHITRECVIATKSTVPIGTNDKIEEYLRNKTNIKLDIASNPEFLAQGTAINDTLHASRIVIGVENEHASNILKKVYEDFDAPLIITNRRSAEMIKYASNSYLALKISYINEIANLCELIGANITDVSKGMGYDNRIGNRFLNAGIGYGGSCFPKDTKALHWFGNFYDYELKTIKAAIEVNETQKLKLIKKARKYYNNFKGLTVAILGLTFKPGTDDLRDAPSLISLPIILEDGPIIKAWDPVGVENFKKIYPNEIFYCNSIDEALEDADICFIFTDWDDIKNYDLSKYTKLMRNAIVLDGRNCYSINDIPFTDMKYECIGIGYVKGIR